MRYSRPITFSISIAVFCALAQAQTPLREVLGVQPGEIFGRALQRVGDVDGDGFEEYAVGHRRGMRIYRGSNGALLRDLNRAEGAIGDLDGDGVRDFWALVRNSVTNVAESLDVLSGVNGVVLANWPWFDTYQSIGQPTYSAPIPLGDVNSDGREDFLRVEYRFGFGVSDAGDVALVSGLDGSTLRTHGDHAIVVPLGDIDADGVDDYFLGEQLPTATPPAVVSGASGTVLATPAALGLFQSLALGVGDVDGDGVRDFVSVAINPASLAPLTLVVSTLTGSVLRTYTDFAAYGGVGPEGVHGDFDGDGVDDHVLYSVDNQRMEARSGATGLVVQTYDAFTATAFGLVDSNGDGRDELLIGVSSARQGAGRTVLVEGDYSELVGTAFAFGDGSSGPCPCANGAPGKGCANSLGSGAELRAWGSASITKRDLILMSTGHWIDVNLLGHTFLIASPNTLAIPQPFGAGLFALGAPIQRIGRSSFGGWDALQLQAWNTWAPAQTVNFQVWYRDGDPAGACGFTSNLSNALSITLTP